jgi:hypothetical protein
MENDIEEEYQRVVEDRFELMRKEKEVSFKIKWNGSAC